jgi:hypothetical protein
MIYNIFFENFYIGSQNTYKIEDKYYFLREVNNISTMNTNINTYLNSFDTVERVGLEIQKIETILLIIQMYKNPYKYLEKDMEGISSQKTSIFDDIYKNVKIEISKDLLDNPILLTDFAKNRIDMLYYKIMEENKVPIHLIQGIKISTKIYKIYTERKKLEQHFYVILPNEFKNTFKMNNYDNIFNIVKDELLYKLDLLLEKYADLM